jgi:hypothetical protein
MNRFPQQTTNRTRPRQRPERFGRMVLAVVATGLVAPQLVPAQEQKPKLPKGEAILDKYVQVTGGQAAYDKLKNRVTKGTIEVVGQNIKFSMTIYAARPNKLYAVLESEALGKTEKGSDGEVAWEMSLMMGPQIKEGEERNLMLREATFDSTENWRKLYAKAECVGSEAVDGKPCYKVVLTPHEGKTTETRFYDQDTNLLAKLAMNIELPMGTIPVEVYQSDYKKVDGVSMAHKARQVIGGVQQMAITIESIEHNADIPKERFKLPEEVQAVLEMQRKEKAQEKESQPGKPETP